MDDGVVTTSSTKSTAKLPADIISLFDSICSSSSILPSSSQPPSSNGPLMLFNRGIGDDAIDELCFHLERIGKRKTHLNLSNNNITSIGASKLFRYLSKGKNAFAYLLLGGNKLDDDVMDDCGKYLKTDKCLCGLWLSSNKISDLGLKIISPYIYGNESLKILFLSENRGITDASVPLCLEMVQSSRIEEIVMDTKTHDSQRAFIVPFFVNKLKNKATKVTIASNLVSTNELSRICEALELFGSKTVEQLRFSDIPIDMDSFCNLMSSLSYLKCLRRISLSNIALDDEMMQIVAEAMTDNDTIEELSLTQSKISDLGIELLCSALIGNTALEELSLEENGKVTDKSVPFLKEVIFQSHLQLIFLSGTSISDDMQEDLFRAIETPLNMRYIPIQSKTKSAAKSDMHKCSNNVVQ